MEEKNQDMVRRMVEAINAGEEAEAVKELFAPRTARRVGRLFAEFRSAFPDWHEEIVKLIAEGDAVAGRFRCSGTHRGEFLGEDPTGKRMEVEEVFFMRAEDGRFVDFWALEDSLNRMRQLGLLPSRSSLQSGTRGRNPALGFPKTPSARSTFDPAKTRHNVWDAWREQEWPRRPPG